MLLDIFVPNIQGYDYVFFIYYFSFRILILEREEVMLNQCVLVGKVKELPVVKKTPNGTSTATLLLDVERGFRNSNGEYEYDTFSITLWRGIAEDTIAFASVGAIIGVRGRLQANVHNANNEVTYYNAEIIAEKVSFLSKNQN